MIGTQPSHRVPLPIASGRQVLHCLWTHLRAHRGAMVMVFALVTTACAGGLVAPRILGWWVDNAGNLTVRDVLWSVIVVVVAAAVGSVCIKIGIPLFMRVGNDILADLREQTLYRVLHLPLSTVNAAGIGDIVTRTRHDVSEVANAFAEHAVGLLMAFLTLVAVAGGLLSVDWRLTIAQMPLSVFLYGRVLRGYLTRSLSLHRQSLQGRSEMAQAAISSLHGRATVRAYMLETRHVNRLAILSQQLKRSEVRKYLATGGFLVRVDAIELVGLGLLLLTGFLSVRWGYVSVGDVTAAGLYCLQTFAPARQLIFRIERVQEAGACLGRLVGIVRMPTEDVAPLGKPGSLASTQLSGDAVPLAFSRVSHRFTDDRGWVLSDVSLTVGPGERVAVVGASAAGKSTLASIGAGLLRPSVGSVLVGGVAVSELNSADRVCLVTQDIHVFAGRLADDVRLGNPGASDDDVWAALEVVCADNWVRALPDGLDTEVGELGYRLTAAQAQQLALARVVLADPRVVILDEATAEAGSAGARILETAADRVTRGRTALVIAHRLSQAEVADRVVVLDQGRIAETGSHAELVAEGGRYSQLWQHWSTIR